MILTVSLLVLTFNLGFLVGDCVYRLATKRKKK